jgi:hypothetical protein
MVVPTHATQVKGPAEVKRDWYTVAQAATEFRRSTRTIRRWLAHGMPHKVIRVGRTDHILISHDALMEARTEANHRNDGNPFKRADQ